MRSALRAGTPHATSPTSNMPPDAISIVCSTRSPWNRHGPGGAALDILPFMLSKQRRTTDQLLCTLR